MPAPPPESDAAIVRHRGTLVARSDTPLAEATIGRVARVARYDGSAEWYDRVNAEQAPQATRLAARLLGEGPGRLLDVGCGGGIHDRVLAENGWSVLGVDISDDQLRLARDRGVEVVEADAHELPFADGSFAAALSIFTHTDLDDFPTVVREVARILEPGGRFVYVGGHPCFVGPHSRFPAARGVPELHPGYWTVGRYTEAPGVTREGLRARVGATHLPLGLFVQAFLDAGFQLERFEEPEQRLYPYMIALRWRR